MENEILPSSSQDAADLSLPRRDSWASVSEQDADPDTEDVEEAEEWEQIIWPLLPVACTSPLLSFATVQWDAPDPTTQMDDEVSAGSSSPPRPPGQEEREEGWSIDLQLLHSVLQRTGSDSEVGWVGDVKVFQIWTFCPIFVAPPFTFAGTCLRDSKKGSKWEHECGKNKSQ